ncbi:hypothetical protein BGZ83_003045 [Gryganskiella cystojenkinii]|nr:hypothetical protein BGZ83_003045 [Gryganskiella cystojenkinii]
MHTTFGLGVGSQTHTENSTSKSTTMTTAATKSVTIAVSTIPTTTAGHKRSLAETLGFTDPEPKQEPLDEHNFNHTPEDTVYDDGDVLMGGAVEHGTSGKRPAMTEQKSNCTGTGSELVDSSMDIDIVEPFAAALAATDIIGQQTNIPSCTPSPLRSSKRSALENHQTIASSRSQSPLITARRSSERTTPLRTTPSRTAAIETQSSSIHVRKSVDPQQERTTSPTELIDTPLEEQSLEDILSPDLMIQPIPRFSGRRPVYKALVYRLDPTLKTVKEVLLEYMVGSPMAKPYTIPSPFVAEPDTRYPAVKDLLVKYEYEWVHKDDRDLLQSRLGVVKMYLVLTEIDELSVKEAIQELEEQQDDRHLIPFGHALAREARARYLAGTAKNLSYCEEEYVPDVEPRRGSAKDFYRGSPRPEEGEIWFSDYGAKGEFTKYGPLRHPTKIFLPDLTITDVEKIWVEWHQGLTHAQGRDRAYWALPGSSKQHYQEFCLRKKIVQSISDGVCTRKVAQIRYAFIELRDLQRGSHNKLVGFADPSDFRTAVFAHKNATVSEIQTKIRVAIAVLLLKQQEEEKENAGLTVQEKEQKEKNTRVRNLQHVKALIQGNIRDRVEASRQRLEASKGKDVVQAA